MRTLETSVEIQAPAAIVWRVFTEPALTYQIGGEYVTDWKVGSPFGFKGTNGEMLTNGELTEIEPAKLLTYRLLDADGKQISLITYALEEKDGITTLRGKEKFAELPTDEAYADALEGWNAALEAVKGVAEGV